MKDELANIFMELVQADTNPSLKVLTENKVMTAFQNYSRRLAYNKYYKLLESFSNQLENKIKGKKLEDYINNDKHLDVVWTSLRACMISPSKELSPYILAQISVKLILGEITNVDTLSKVVNALESLNDNELRSFLQDYEEFYPQENEKVNIELKARSDDKVHELYKLKLNTIGIVARYVKTMIGASSDMDADFYIVRQA